MWAREKRLHYGLRAFGCGSDAVADAAKHHEPRVGKHRSGGFGPR